MKVMFLGYGMPRSTKTFLRVVRFNGKEYFQILMRIGGMK